VELDDMVALLEQVKDGLTGQVQHAATGEPVENPGRLEQALAHLASTEMAITALFTETPYVAG
jgi:hypothetical protein